MGYVNWTLTTYSDQYIGSYNDQKSCEFEYAVLTNVLENALMLTCDTSLSFTNFISY